MRLASCLGVFIFFVAAIPAGAQESGFNISTPEQIREDVSTVPCDDKKRLESVKSLFERAGLPSSEVTTGAGEDQLSRGQ